MLSEFSIFKEPAYFVLSKLGGEVIGFSLFMGIVTVITLVIKLNYLSKIVDLELSETILSQPVKKAP